VYMGLADGPSHLDADSLREQGADGKINADDGTNAIKVLSEADEAGKNGVTDAQDALNARPVDEIDALNGGEKQGGEVERKIQANGVDGIKVLKKGERKSNRDESENQRNSNRQEGKGGSNTIITPEMEQKILYGKRKNPAKNELIGGHSPQINNANPNYAVEILNINTDGTQKVKFVTQYSDGNLSNIKTSTLFPNSWSNEQIINNIKIVGNTTPIGVRKLDGAILHRSIIDGVQVEVIKIGDNVTSAYPTGGIKTDLLPGFSNMQ